MKDSTPAQDTIAQLILDQRAISTGIVEDWWSYMNIAWGHAGAAACIDPDFSLMMPTLLRGLRLGKQNQVCVLSRVLSEHNRTCPVMEHSTVQQTSE